MKKKVFSFCFVAVLLIASLCGCITNHSEPISTYSSQIQDKETSQQDKSTIPANDGSNANLEKSELSITANLDLEVHFIDVGQADAALLISDGHYMLIDGGNVEDSSLIYSYLNKRNITYLDYVIGTHAHEDHIGGLSGALQKAEVGTIYMPKTGNDAEFYQKFLNKVSSKSLTLTNPSSGTSFQFGNCNIQLLCPETENPDELNNTSIMAKIVCGKTSFLFTGDAESEEERDILSQNYDLSATVLKAGHHGSETSSSYPFLREVMPKYVVISVGKNNQYGHPNESVLSRFRDVGAEIYRTDLQGGVIFKSNGEEISISTQKNKNVITNPTITQGSENSQAAQSANQESQYIGNKNSKKFHRPSCNTLPVEKNRVYLSSRHEAIEKGFTSCQNCNP